MNISHPTLIQLVNAQGEFTGIAEKLSAHREGLLHLAFSVLLYRIKDGRVQYFLQKRADDKYHSGGLWTNTCCSHPYPNESPSVAAKRRLKEELGILQPIILSQTGRLIYRHELDNDMVEHEYDIVFAGKVDALDYQLNAEEASAVEWWDKETLTNQVNQVPLSFTAWFPAVLNSVNKHVENLHQITQR
jgi:isopentenyl-diphosphate delta-isomerase